MSAARAAPAAAQAALAAVSPAASLSSNDNTAVAGLPAICFYILQHARLLHVAEVTDNTTTIK